MIKGTSISKIFGIVLFIFSLFFAGYLGYENVPPIWIAFITSIFGFFLFVTLLPLLTIPEDIFNKHFEETRKLNMELIRLNNKNMKEELDYMLGRKK